jgi:16S rRNA (guanine527-N7)-methyltransferase
MLAPAEAVELGRFYSLLTKWNQRINLTALELGSIPPPATIDRLFIEPLVAAELIPKSTANLADLGTGAGSPAIPLKVLRPSIALSMVEIRGRKAAFLREAVRTLRLGTTDVHQARFQDFGESNAGRFDVVVMRALRMDDELLAAVARLLRTGGRFITFGAEQPRGFSAEKTVALPGGSTAGCWLPKR